MSSYYVLQAQERSSFEMNAPTQENINAAFASTSMTGRGVPVIAQWVGLPRITRNALPPNYVTNVAAVVQVAGDGAIGVAQAQATADNLKQQLDHIDTGLFASSNWGDVSVTPFSEAVNGPLSLWASGQMAVTQTAANFPSAIGATPENPIGVTSAATTPQGITIPGLPNPTPALNNLKWIVGGVAVITAFWYLGPIVSLWVSGAKNRQRTRQRLERSRQRALRI